MEVSGSTRRDLFVCSNCFADTGIAKFVQEHAVVETCSFCGSKSDHSIAAPLDDVADHVASCLFREFTDANGELHWDKEEESLWGSNWESEELLIDEIQLELPNDDRNELLPALVNRLPDITWCEINGMGLNDHEVAKYSWEKFCDVTMHQRRFFFMNTEPDRGDPEVMSPSDTLETVWEFAHKAGLLACLPAGTHLYRARREGTDACHETAVALGPPPEDTATQENRMSPAGVVMFYAADDEETALRETANKQDCFAVGQFETLRCAVVLDLSAIPEMPSLFESDPAVAEIRRIVTFLSHVAEQISRPIERTDRIHIEYVPTQVLTEFVRSKLTGEGSLIDGIKYGSSVHPGHYSYVLFATQDNVVGTTGERFGDDRWLKLTDVNHVCFDPGRPADKGEP